MVKSRLTGNRLSSLPSAQQCNPLVSNQDEYDRLMGYLLEFVKRNDMKYVEMKTGQEFQFDSEKFGQVNMNYRTHILNIDGDTDDIQSAFHKSQIQRAIKRARKSGLELVRGDSLEDVKILYDLYLNMRQRYGLLPQPFSFFANMWRYFTEGNHVEILHAKHNGRMISSILLLQYKDTVFYEYGSTMPGMHIYSPSIFLLWESIKLSYKQGYKKFDFGRTSIENRGLLEFKSRWGTVCETLPYYYIPSQSGMAELREKNGTKKMMNFFVKNSPTSICRLMGGAAYKHLV